MKLYRNNIIDISESRSSLIGGYNFEHNDDIDQKGSFRAATNTIYTTLLPH